MVQFPNIYLNIIYKYILNHDGEQILYKNIKQIYGISYPTIRKKIDWLVSRNFIRREKRRFWIIPRY